jgi:hypothetical protein
MSESDSRRTSLVIEEILLRLVRVWKDETSKMIPTSRIDKSGLSRKSASEHLMNEDGKWDADSMLETLYSKMRGLGLNPQDSGEEPEEVEPEPEESGTAQSKFGCPSIGT